MEPFDPPPGLLRGVARVTGRRPVVWHSRVGGGYTAARRLIATFSDGGTAFVKAAATQETAAFIRAELPVYERLNGQGFLPAFLGGDTGGDADLSTTFLVLEDLSGAHWPPPWTTARIDAVLQALRQVRACLPLAPPGLPYLEDTRGDFARWHRVAADPTPFLSLNLCSHDWLDAALPTLLAADDAAPLQGDALVHLDVRSDNLCFRRSDGRAVLVDWNFACRGNAQVDIACWLPSLHAEGGPLPETILPDAGLLASLLAGFWAASAGLPAPPTAPRVRDVQKRQLAVALPWAARALGLPPPRTAYNG